MSLDPTSRPHGPTVVVLAGGDAVDRRLASRLPRADVVIAADSGLEVAHPLGLAVDLVVGDMDSVSPEALAAARADGITVEEHPADKDRTDLAIAMDAALGEQPDRIVVVGGHGGRLDHLLGNAALLASPAYAAVAVVALMGTATVTVVRRRGMQGAPTVLTGEVGGFVSLLPFHGTARGVTTAGLRFPLHEAELAAGSSLGVSNQFAAPEATVAVDDGVLLAVQP